MNNMVLEIKRNFSNLTMAGSLCVVFYDLCCQERVCSLESLLLVTTLQEMNHLLIRVFHFLVI